MGGGCGMTAEPLFRKSGRGFTPAALCRPLLAYIGWSDGLLTMPAEKLVLRSKQNCDGFEIYVVEFDR